MGDEKEVKNDEKSEKGLKSKTKTKKNKKGIFARIWSSLFRLGGSDDFEKRLQYITKEEGSIVVRMKRRAMGLRRTARNLVIFSVLIELVAIGYAIMTTRTVDMEWRMRSLRVLPMFLLPALSFALYYGLQSFTKFYDRRDQKTLEKLRAERQSKIDELKERTNYYITQQLIQKYDPDPAAKAAAASVLASKLGADSGLKVFLGDEPQQNPYATGKSSDTELQQSTGLRKRNQSNTRSSGSNAGQQSAKEVAQYGENEVSENSPQSQLIVDHHNSTSLGAQDGGWIARIAALLVGEDPTQSYALICGNCHMHNGLARKEEFPFITYYCPHCNALNKPKDSALPSNIMAPVSGSSPVASAGVSLIEPNKESKVEKESAASSPVGDVVEEKEATESKLTEDPSSH